MNRSKNQIITILTLVLLSCAMLGSITQFTSASSPIEQTVSYYDKEVELKVSTTVLYGQPLRTQFNEPSGMEKVVTQLKYFYRTSGEPESLVFKDVDNDGKGFQSPAGFTLSSSTSARSNTIYLNQQWLSSNTHNIEFWSDDAATTDSVRIFSDWGSNAHSQIYDYGSWHSNPYGEFAIEVQWESVQDISAAENIKSGSLTGTEDFVDFYKIELPAESTFELNLETTGDSANILVFDSFEMKTENKIGETSGTGNSENYEFTSSNIDIQTFYVAIMLDSQIDDSATYSLTYTEELSICDSPTWVTADQSISTDNIDVSWTNVNNADTYKIYVNGTLDQTINAPTTTKNINLAENKIYELTITAENSTGVSLLSDPLVITVEIPPAVPTMISTDFTTNVRNFEILWSQSSYSDSYVLELGVDTIETLSTNTWVGTDSDGIYNMRVKGINAFGSSSYSDWVSVTVDTSLACCSLDVPTISTENQTITDESLYLEWSEVTGCEDYFIYVDGELYGGQSSYWFGSSGFIELKEGSHEITVSASDSNGETIQSNPINVTYEPLVILEKPELINSDETVSTSEDVLISWLGSSHADYYWIYVDGELYTSTDFTETTVTLTFEEIGDYVITVKAVSSIHVDSRESDPITITVEEPVNGDEPEDDPSIPGYNLFLMLAVGSIAVLMRAEKIKNSKI